MDKLRVVVWNAQSVKSKAIPLGDFLHQHKIDIALIVETFLKPDLSLYIENYTIHRLDRPAETRGGGVAIAVRKPIQHKLLSHYKTSIIEAIGIRVQTQTGSFNLISAYCPKQCTYPLVFIF